MKVTINTPRRVVYLEGYAHCLSQAGCNRLLMWLMDNSRLMYGWADSGEYIFEVAV